MIFRVHNKMYLCENKQNKNTTGHVVTKSKYELTVQFIHTNIDKPIIMNDFIQWI